MSHIEKAYLNNLLSKANESFMRETHFHYFHHGGRLEQVACGRAFDAAYQASDKHLTTERRLLSEYTACLGRKN
jgi:hypothetical protein